MNKPNYYTFETVFIEKKCQNHPRIAKILSRIEGNPQINVIDNLPVLLKKIGTVQTLKKRLKTLYLGTMRGEILQRCPGSHGHICCNYHVINLYLGCPLGCTYCILQAYLNQPATVINVDLEQIFENLDHIFRADPDRLFRIGTGELGDSLVYDPLTDFSKDFIRFFSHYKNTIFEFKTKTNLIDNLLQQQTAGNIVVGFSVNPQSVIDQEEGYACTLMQRLEAAQLLVEKGYRISLHFDPIIHIQNFEIEYCRTVDLIFSYISPQDIAWISLGTFRYMPDLKNMIEYNYPASRILLDEFLECEDKKFRYFKPLRIKLYQTVIEALLKKNQELPIYLCMESPEVWQKTVRITTGDDKRLKFLFDSLSRRK